MNQKRRSMGSIKETTENSLQTIKSFFHQRASPRESDSSGDTSRDYKNKRKSVALSMKSFFSGSGTGTPKSPNLSERSSDSNPNLIKFDQEIFEMKVPSLEGNLKIIEKN